MIDSIIVSVIIPTYKRSDTLIRAIDSALNQTFKELEVIVVDDNDPKSEYRETTEKLMERYSQDKRVLYIKHPKNMNGAAARNTGLKVSNGKYIAFLDDDDFYYPIKIEKQVKFLEANAKYNGVYCGRKQKGRFIYAKLQGDLSEYILTQTFTPTTPALMFRKECLVEMNGFNENFRRHQDFELLLRFFRNNSLGAIEEPLVEIGQNDGENDLHGVELEKNKNYFLQMFDADINRIDKEVKGFRRKVYITHYSAIFCDHLSMHYFKSAFKIYKKGCKISFFTFNIAVINYVGYYLKTKLRRIF